MTNTASVDSCFNCPQREVKWPSNDFEHLTNYFAQHWFNVGWPLLVQTMFVNEHWNTVCCSQSVLAFSLVKEVESDVQMIQTLSSLRAKEVRHLRFWSTFGREVLSSPQFNHNLRASCGKQSSTLLFPLLRELKDIPKTKLEGNIQSLTILMSPLERERERCCVGVLYLEAIYHWASRGRLRLVFILLLIDWYPAFM